MTNEEYMRIDAEEEKKARELAEGRLKKRIEQATRRGQYAFSMWCDCKAFELEKLGFQVFEEKENYMGYRLEEQKSRESAYDSTYNKVYYKTVTYRTPVSSYKTVCVKQAVKFVSLDKQDSDRAWEQADIYTKGFLQYKSMRDGDEKVPKAGECFLFNLFTVLSSVFSLLFYFFGAFLWESLSDNMWDVNWICSMEVFADWKMPNFVIYLFFALSILCMVSTVVLYKVLLGKYNLKSGKNKKSTYYAKILSIVYLILAGIIGVALVVFSVPSVINGQEDLCVLIEEARGIYLFLSCIYFIVSFFRTLFGNPYRKYSKLARKRKAYLNSEECAKVKKAMEFLKSL